MANVLRRVGCVTAPGIMHFSEDTPRTLRSGLLRSCERFPERPAISIEDRTLSYRELFSGAARIAATLQELLPDTSPALTAVLGHRSFTAFQGIVAALLRGHGYVPLNPAFPLDRTADMLQRSSARGLVVEGESIAQLEVVLGKADEPLVVVLPDLQDVSVLCGRFPQHRFVAEPDLLPAEALRPSPVDPNGIVYLLFTSGSTGRPKGVMVAHRNVTHFVDYMTERYAVTEQDRFSQTFDLTFDLSAFDMFVAWERGACLCVPTAGQKLFPGKYLKSQGITIWFSVPSTAVLMNRMRMLKPDSYPTLRYSLFCGEALPVEIASAWQKAAPASVVENLYGPTELTIACTLYRFRGDESLPDCELGLVPIGEPYPEMEVLVADAALLPVAEGEAGELLMSGPQLTLGYWQDPDKTQAAFVVPQGRDRVYYRTGDRVRRRPNGTLVYLGRVDNQIKIQGYRVELGEIEAAVRDEAQVDVAVAVGFPRTPSGADGVVVFISAPDADLSAICQSVSQRLPAYMQPRQVRHIADFPLNANGKVDRSALLGVLEREAAS